MAAADLGADSALKGRVVYQRILSVFSVLAALAIGLHAAVAVAAVNELTWVESIIAAQSRTFAEHGALYYDLRNYPYTICAYMPSFYLLEAGLYRLGVPLLQAGRLISLAAMLSILWLLWRTIKTYTGDKYAAWTGLVLAGVTQLLVSWSTVAQSDVLAVAFTLASLYFYSRHHVLGENTLTLAAICALAGLLTKQTVIAAPVAIFLLLIRPRPGLALQFAAKVAGVGGLIVLGLDFWLDGRFLFNTVFANLNPFAWYKFHQQLQAAFFAALCLLPIVALGVRRAFRAGLGGPFVYLACATLVFLATCGKIGSASNYRIELSIALILCTCLCLHALDFFPLVFRQSRSWVTLLLLPLGVYAVQNLRFISDSLRDEIAFERGFSAQTSALRPLLAGKGRILSADINALFRTGRPVAVETLIYRLLVEAGRVDPTKLNLDLEAGVFSRILLYEDVNQAPGTNPEIPRLTQAQSAIIRDRYRLVARIPGPYFYGLYVYEPRAASPPPESVQ